MKGKSDGSEETEEEARGVVGVDKAKPRTEEAAREEAGTRIHARGSAQPDGSQDDGKEEASEEEGDHHEGQPGA